jgi:hypothetical protein
MAIHENSDEKKNTVKRFKKFMNLRNINFHATSRVFVSLAISSEQRAHSNEQIARHC